MKKNDWEELEDIDELEKTKALAQKKKMSTEEIKKQREKLFGTSKIPERRREQIIEDNRPMWQRGEDSYSPFRNLRKSGKLQLYTQNPAKDQEFYKKIKKDLHKATPVQKQILEAYLAKFGDQIDHVNIYDHKSFSENKLGNWDNSQKSLNLVDKKFSPISLIDVLNHELTHAASDLDHHLGNDPELKSYIKNAEGQRKEIIEEAQNIIDPLGSFKRNHLADGLSIPYQDEKPSKTQGLPWDFDEFNAYIIENINNPFTASATNNTSNNMVKKLLEKQQSYFNKIASTEQFPDINPTFSNRINEMNKLLQQKQQPRSLLDFQGSVDEILSDPTRHKNALKAVKQFLSTRHSTQQQPPFAQPSSQLDNQFSQFGQPEVQQRNLNRPNQQDYSLLGSQNYNALAQRNAIPQQNQQHELRQNRFDRPQSRNRSNRRQEESNNPHYTDVFNRALNYTDPNHIANPGEDKEYATGGTVSFGLGSLSDYINHRYAGGGGVGLGDMGRFFGLYPSDY